MLYDLIMVVAVFAHHIAMTTPVGYMALLRLTS